MTLNLTKLLFNRNIINNSSHLILQSFNSKLMNNGIRYISIKVVKPCPAPIKEGYDQRNQRLKRVMSPHLTIYKPQLTSMLSISNRIAGCGLIFYTAIFGLGAIFLPHDFSYYKEMVEDLELNSTALMLLKMQLAFPFVFHFFSGIRHLSWDAGYGLGLKQVYLTGYLMLAGTVAGTVALSVLL